MLHIFGKDSSTNGLRIFTGEFQQVFSENQNLVIHLLKGKLQLQFTDKKETLAAKDLFFMKANTSVSLKSTTNETYVLLYFVSTSLLNSVLDMTRYTFKTEKVQPYSQQEKINESSLQIASYLKESGGNLDFHLLALSANFLDHLSKTALIYQPLNKATDTRMNEILHYLETNMTKIITLDEIAAYFNVSSAYFSRFFKKQVGINFTEYLTNLRLEKAAAAIRSSSEQISVIADQTGFVNINGFNRKFKERYGYTPRDYRKQFSQQLPNEPSDSSQHFLQQLPTDGKEEQLTKYQEIVFDAKGTSNSYPWKQIMNIGSAEDLLQSDLRNHVNRLKKELDLSYIRFWNLFTKGMNIDPTITTAYNFEKIDSVLDFLVKENLRPFIELRYKIRRLHSSTREHLVYENEDFKFRLNSEEWFDLLRQFMRHIRNRYGLSCIRTWMFEFSFEHYQGTDGLEELITHYKKTYELIKQYSDTIKIGGPGAMVQVSSAYDYQRDLKLFEANEVAFDFLSYLIYPYQVDTGGERNAKRIATENYLPEVINALRETLNQSSYRQKELYITEWNNTISNRNAINDSLFKGSYLIKNLAAIVELVDGIAYWVGSDIFSEFIDSRAILHGGAGLLAKGSIPKPAFHALRFMNFLNQELIINLPGIIASKNEEEREVSLILYNYQAPNVTYYLTEENKIHIEEIDTYFDEEKCQAIALSFQLAPQQLYEIKMFRVNHSSGNVISGWRDLGYRHSLRKKDLEYLKLKADPDIKFQQAMTDVEGKLNLRQTLAANEFIYIALTPIDSEVAR